MSGGHFDYAYHIVENFCDILKRNIRDNKKKDEFGYAPEFTDEVIAELKKILIQTKKTAELMYHVEWLMSGDDSEETFLENIRKVK